MATRLMKHNPAFLTREELCRSFVTRLQDLDFVLEHIEDNTGASSQHLLIVAPRGMGKTTLVLRAAEAVRSEERFSKIWFPLVYAEETYEVMSAGELWLEGLRHLGEQTKSEEILAAHKELRGERDEQRLYDRALGRLIDFADRIGKRILLVIENLHMLLGEQISEADAWRLRKTLQTERKLMLVATATTRFEAIENSSHAFFDQFRMYELEPLDLEGARALWNHVAEAPVSTAHIRPLHILTGGNPRLLAILASFAGGMSLRTLMGDLVHLVDDHTTYFKSNLDSLPAKERKVYVTLADLWQPSTAREVADQARMTPSEVSALLNRLTQRGAVTSSGDERKKLYQLAERMYNIYHLLRRSGGDATRVRAVVDFIVGFYDPMSMGRVVRAIAEEGASLNEEERRDHLLVMESLFQREGNMRVRELWLKEVSPHVTSWPDTPAGLRSEPERIRAAREEALIRGAWLPLEEVKSLFRDGIRALHEILADRPDRDWRASVEAFSLAGPVEAGVAGVFGLLAEGGRVALAAFSRALQGKHSAKRRAALLCGEALCAWSLGDVERAQGGLREAVALAPEEPSLHANLARVLISDHGLEAEEHAVRAIEQAPSNELSWMALAFVFARMQTSDLLSRESVYGPVLKDRRASRAQRTIAGLWKVGATDRSGDEPGRRAGLLALRKVWKHEEAPAIVGVLLLDASIASLDMEEAEGILTRLSGSFDQRVILGAFNIVWKSAAAAVHELARPHLGLLLGDENLGESRLPLIGLQMLLGPFGDAQASCERLLRSLYSNLLAEKPQDETLQLWTRLFVDAAATGHAFEALGMLAPSPLARWLEPVVVALHAYLGQSQRAPLEVTEVGRDVVERIRARAAALKAGAHKAPAAPETPTDEGPPKAPPPARKKARRAPRRLG